MVTMLPSASDQAWKVLDVVSEAVRHAERKGAVTMGAAGVIGGSLYDVVRNQVHAAAALYVAAVACGVLVTAAAIFAGLCLMPRLRRKDDPSSLVYFHHIARRHQGASGSSDYRKLLKNLSADDDLLIEDLGTQIWTNTQVAYQKYQMISFALAALLPAVVALAATVIMALVPAA